jgi:hypothetical protein
MLGGSRKLWNGALLTTVETALQWASNMTWNGLKPLVQLVDGVYQKQITVPKGELEVYEQQWQRSQHLPKWDITVVPNDWDFIYLQLP